jgi:hypothetical protein
MTTVRVKPVVEGSGDPILSILTISLVDQSGVRITAWHSETMEPISVFISRAIKHQALTFELFPSSVISTPVGTTAYYRFALSTVERDVEIWNVTLPDTAQVLDLFTLVEAEEIASSFPANRLLPSSATAGQFVTWDDTLKLWVATSVTPGAGDMHSLVYDPQGVYSDAFDAANLRGRLDGGTFN